MSQIVEIHISVKDAVYQVKARTYRTGQQFGKTPEETANIQASADDIAVRDIEADVRRALSEIAGAMNPYVVQYFEEEFEKNEDNGTKGDWLIELDMPFNYDTRATRSIQDAAFRYIVCRALADWYTDVKPDSAAPFTTEAELRMNEVKAALNRRVLNNYNAIS
jgi:hypothetical protein